MPRGQRRPYGPTQPSGSTEVRDFAKRMARAETTTRIVCLLLGLMFAVGSLVFFILVIRLGLRAASGAVIGALFLAVPAWLLLRRGLTGRDVDRHDADDLTTHDPRIGWR